MNNSLFLFRYLFFTIIRHLAHSPPLFKPYPRRGRALLCPQTITFIQRFNHPSSHAKLPQRGFQPRPFTTTPSTHIPVGAGLCSARKQPPSSRGATTYHVTTHPPSAVFNLAPRERWQSHLIAGEGLPSQIVISRLFYSQGAVSPRPPAPPGAGASPLDPKPNNGRYV